MFIVICCTTLKSQDKYNIQGTITYNARDTLETFVKVAKGGHLIIQKGSIITIENYISIEVYGKITAKGTKEDPIIFQVKDTTGFSNTRILDGGWNGISFFNCNSDTSVLEHCIIQNVKSTEFPNLEGNGIYLYNSNNVFIRYTTLRNNIGRTGGGIRIYKCEPVISQCIFENNIALEAGGGLYAYNSDGLAINNCVFSGNSSLYGGAVYLHNSDKTQLINSTIVRNTASRLGSVLKTKKCKKVSIYNNIIYHNLEADECQLEFTETRSVYLVSNNIENQHLFPIGWDNIDVEPKFIDLNGGDLRLKPESNCIDAGMNKYQPGLYDADGNARLWPASHGNEPIIDLGAYEYGAHTYPELSYSKEDISDIDSVNGKIILEVNEGTAPYSYLWDDGNTDSTRTNLAPGIYHVCIEDAYGLKDSAEIAINFAGSFFYIKGKVHNNQTNIASGVVLAFENSGDEYVFRNLGEIKHGQYFIPALENKDYLLYAIPTDENAKEYIPGYYVNKNKWEQSFWYYLQGPALGVDISLQNLNHTESGLGSIVGKLEMKSENEIRTIQDNLADPKNRPLLASVNYPILLLKEDEIIDWSFCDSNNEFRFNNLNYGNYTVRLEYPGKVMEQNYTIALDEKNQTQEVLLAMDKNRIQTYLLNDLTSPLDQSFCYPNPVKEKIHINFNYYPVTDLKLSVYTKEGRLIKHELVNKTEGVLTVTSDLSEVPPGVYILKLSTSGKLKNFKLVKF